MKKKFVSLMAVAAMLLGTACSNQLDDVDVMNNGVVELEETSAPSAEVDIWGENLSYDEIDVDAYIEAHPETFGNVLAFNSMDDVVDLLDEMGGLNYQDMSAKYEELQNIRNFSNDIIESNILYEQIYTEVAAEFGYDLLNEEEEIGNEDFYEALEIRLLEEENSLISVQEKTFTDNETNETISGVFIEPICSLGIDALVNDKHIVVIDKSVLYFIEDAIVSMPINKYHHLADYQFSSSEALEMALNSNGITGLTIEDFVISYRGRQGAQNATTLAKTEKHHVGFNSSKDRMMTADIGAYETQYYFVTLVGELTIINYKKTRLQNWVKKWSNIQGGVSFRVYYECENFPYSQPMLFDFTNPYYVRGKKTFQRSTPIGITPITDIQPYNISISLRNGQGCYIQY